MERKLLSRTWKLMSEEELWGRAPGYPANRRLKRSYIKESGSSALKLTVNTSRSTLPLRVPFSTPSRSSPPMCSPDLPSYSELLRYSLLAGIQLVLSAEEIDCPCPTPKHLPALPAIHTHLTNERAPEKHHYGPFNTFECTCFARRRKFRIL